MNAAKITILGQIGLNMADCWRNGLQICHWLLFQDPEIRMGFQIFTVQSTPFPRKEISKKKKKKKKKKKTFTKTCPCDIQCTHVDLFMKCFFS